MDKARVTWNEQTKTIAEWAQTFGVSVDALCSRLLSMDTRELQFPDCVYPDCLNCVYPDCMTDELHPGELRMNGQWSGLPQLLLSDKRLRMWNADTMNEDEEDYE